MTARLTLICHGSTDAVRAAAFPKDEPLDHHGKIGATVLIERVPSVDCGWASPELRTRQTAEALELSPKIEPMLRECEYGRWAGKRFSVIVADEPDAANSWLSDPTAAPHGGESILDLVDRVAMWLADETVNDQRTIAITHSTIIRATIVYVMDAPPQSFWRIDIGPLSVTRLSCLRGRWNLSAAGCTTA